MSFERIKKLLTLDIKKVLSFVLKQYVTGKPSTRPTCICSTVKLSEDHILICKPLHDNLKAKHPQTNIKAAIKRLSESTRILRDNAIISLTLESDAQDSEEFLEKIRVICQ